MIILLILFVIGIGFFLQAKIDVSYLRWIGHLPGDFIIHKGPATIYLPWTSSLIFSVVVFLLISKWSKGL